jgi:YHS domain-containing protein
MHKPTKKTDTVLDPVCGMVVSQPITEIASTIKDQTYYFCTEECREAFVTDPQKYLNKALVKKKGLWDRYLKRLEKVTGGKSMNCH